MTQKKGNKQKLPTPKPLSEQAIEARRNYQRSYYQRNKAKRQAWNNNHWERVAQNANNDERQED